jgi:hypothetical protein
MPQVRKYSCWQVWIPDGREVRPLRFDRAVSHETAGVERDEVERIVGRIEKSGPQESR